MTSSNALGVATFAGIRPSTVGPELMSILTVVTNSDCRPLVRPAGELAWPIPLRGIDQAHWESFSGACDGVGQIAVAVGHHRCVDCPGRGVARGCEATLTSEPFSSFRATEAMNPASGASRFEPSWTNTGHSGRVRWDDRRSRASPEARLQPSTRSSRERPASLIASVAARASLQPSPGHVKAHLIPFDRKGHLYK